jgi:SOS response regulatory protein OraA/RecX
MNTPQEELIHLRADFEAVRAGAMNELRAMMPSMRDVARALERPTITDDKRKFLAEVLQQRLDVIQDVIDRLDKAKAL